MSNGAGAPAPNPYVARLEKLEAEVADLKRVLAAVGAAFGGGSSDGGAATDRELDHPQHGDPDVKVLPRDWTAGGVVKGQKFSRCPADFLELIAETYMFFAERNDAAGAKDGKGNPKSVWDKKTARLARGWARRIRAGWTPPPAPPAPPDFGSNGSGFGSGNGGFGLPGTTRSWGSNGDGSSNGHRGFLGAAPPAAPPPSDSSAAHDPDGFDFGHNVGQPTTTPTTDALEDDDPPL